MDRMTDGESNTLAMRGLEELFSSCAVVSVFCSGRKYRFWFKILLTPYVLRVPYSCLPYTVGTYAAAPHHGGQNYKPKILITVIPSGNTLPPAPMQIRGIVLVRSCA